MIQVLPLGAGQDVGRSCILVKLEDKTILFDCGMHMGYHDARRFPDFTLLPQLSCVIISHFHLDHCGALPFLTGVAGYKGPIVMTSPTRTICPLLLEDYRKIVVERRGEAVEPGAFFTGKMIEECMAQVVIANLGEWLCIDGINIMAMYAGHVLGAAMFLAGHAGQSVLYTGDYNMTPDRHLGAARILQPLPTPFHLPLDLLITESTYATTVRESKRARERDFLRAVHNCVAAGGKVLIPTFALGRAQELCLLIDTYWTRMGLEATPVYFSAGLAQRANEYYGMHLDWTNESIKASPENPFNFRNIRPFERAFAELPGPMVLFSTPGMLHSGQSLHVFAKWASDARNMLIIPGYCVAGTVGAKVLAGHKKVDIDVGNGSVSVDVRIQVKNLSFSAHADAKGIMQLVKMTKPRNVMLVHGERQKMAVLKAQIEQQYSTPCYDPANGQYVFISCDYDQAGGMVAPELLSARSLEISLAAQMVAECGLFDDCETRRLLMQSVGAQSANAIDTMAVVGVGPAGGLIAQPVGEYKGLKMCVHLRRRVPAGFCLSALHVHMTRLFHPEVAIACRDGGLRARSVQVDIADDEMEIYWNVIDDALAKSMLHYVDNNT